MFSAIGWFSFSILLCSLARQAVGIPLEQRAVSATSDALSTPPFSLPLHVPSLQSGGSSLNDWRDFVYRIPHTKRILKGRISINNIIPKPALHYTIIGGRDTAKARRHDTGDGRLEDRDNPFEYQLVGCGFRMTSNGVWGEALMTYGMVVEVFDALEQVLEKRGLYFGATFILTDEDRRNWGRGEIVEKLRSGVVLTS